MISHMSQKMLTGKKKILSVIGVKTMCFTGSEKKSSGSLLMATHSSPFRH